MKKLLIIISLLSLATIGFATDTLTFVVEGDTFTILAPAGENRFIEIGASLDSTIQEGTKVVKKLKEGLPTNTSGWLNLLIFLVPILTSLGTRVTRTWKTAKTIFDSTDTRDIVYIIGIILAGITEAIISGLEFSAIDWGAYTALTIPLSILFYNATKKLFGKTKKVEE